MLIEKADDRVLTIKETLREAVDVIDQAHQVRFPYKGVSTGFQEIDQKIGGLQKGDLVYALSEHKHLRQSFTLSTVINVAASHNHVAYFVSDEQPSTIGTQIISSVGRIRFDELQAARLSEKQWRKLITSTEEALEFKLSLIKFTELNVVQLRKHLLALNEDMKVRLVVIDNIQRLSIFTVARRTELLEELKELAVDLEIAIVVFEDETTLHRRKVSRKDKTVSLPYMKVLDKHAEHVDTIMFLKQESKQSDEGGIVKVRIRNRDSKLRMDDVQLFYRPDIFRLDSVRLSE